MPLAYATETIALEGPVAPIDVLIDRWGVPHIFAETGADAFFAQGFAVARDRLWQIDVWRKRGLGRLAEDYGPSHHAADRAARLLLYRGDMAAEWAAYGPEARGAAERFVAGINAFIDLLGQRPELLPVEFAGTGTRPARWQAEDCVRIRSHGPLFNFGRELARADVVERFGPEGEAARRRLEPDWTMTLPEGIAAEAIPPEVRQVFELATGQPAFGALPEDLPSSDAGGSNNWAIAAERTATGRPILASDPHRLLFLPSLRYVSHLSAPGLDVIGAGEPGVPGIALGHNQTSAFCFTIHPADQSDLYVYELHPDDPMLYRWHDGWERMTSIVETIAVCGEAARSETLLFTRHGPVLHVAVAANRAYAMRSIWTEAGTAPYMASLRYLAVDSWDGFVAARQHWQSPPVNHVYADVSGAIGWIMSGSVPVRPNWDGLLPVPGDGTHEWAGYMPADAHPRSHNPGKGWVATANEMNLPADFDVARHKIGFEWPDPSRARVISEALSVPPPHSLADSQRLQTSVRSLPAERLVATLAGIALVDAGASAARAHLLGWNGELGPHSSPAFLFEVWYRRHLIEAVSEAMAPGAAAAFDAHDIAQFDTGQVTDLITAPDERLGANFGARRDAIVEATLAAAWADAVALGGPDPAAWRWGEHHHARFTHPLATLLGDETLNSRRIGKGGSGLTPNAADYRPEDFRMIVGASFRMVLDIGAWDNSVFVNAPGQSGDPRSRHYDDHLEAWGAERYLPLLYSREAIEGATRTRLRLTPAGEGR